MIERGSVEEACCAKAADEKRAHAKTIPQISFTEPPRTFKKAEVMLQSRWFDKVKRQTEDVK
jgi:hypothetical protein